MRITLVAKRSAPPGAHGSPTIDELAIARLIFGSILVCVAATHLAARFPAPLAGAEIAVSSEAANPDCRSGELQRALTNAGAISALSPGIAAPSGSLWTLSG